LHSHFYEFDANILNFVFKIFFTLFQVHRIDFDDENNIINKTTFIHPDGELWQVSASTMTQNVIATVYNHSMFFCL